jgi:conjugal transfer pilus assembly protein TraB
MEATLLSGLDAPVVKEAKNNPVPVLIRIKNLAVLPNQLKANLKGCFVIAEGYGSLADERAHLRLVSLSCIAKNGQAVIDQKIKGFVVDEDGKIGLKGNVVSKMGAAVSRSALAGFFGGLGDGLRAAATAQSISPLGTTQTIKTDDIALGATGTGIASGFGELQKFYLELARQSMPVIEVGATKTITLVVSEGVSLEIKDYCIQGGENC